MLAPGGEFEGSNGEDAGGSAVPDQPRTGRDRGSHASGAKRASPILAWVSRSLCLGWREERKTRRRIEAEIQASVKAHEAEKEQLRRIAANLPEDLIRRHEVAAAQRLRAIEDKARANLLSITIGVAVLFAGLDLLAGGGMGVELAGGLRVLVAVGFVAAVVYFLLGGLMALRALEVERVFVPRLEEEAERSALERSMQALWDLKQNEKTVFLRTNALSSSSYGLRNGVVCLTALVILLAGCIVLANSGSPIAGSSTGPAPSARADSLQPAAPADTHPSPSTNLENPPSVVDDSIAAPEVVDTVSGSVTSRGPSESRNAGAVPLEMRRGSRDPE